jgi:hypothetical protein
MLAVTGDGGLRPFGRREAPGQIIKNKTASSGVRAGDDDAGLIGILI